MNKEQVLPHPGFTPFAIKGRRLSNRFVVAPMSRVSATGEGIATENMKRYYTAFAHGGFSMIITEGLYTDLRYSRAYPLQPGIVTPKQLDAWKAICASVRSRDGVFIAQLMHAGAISQSLPVTMSASAVQPLGRPAKEYGIAYDSFRMPQEMTETDIEDAIDGFIQSARNAYRTGFAGVELHGANGYLLDQFLTPHTNRREDTWGGGVKNRFRIIAEIIGGIRKEVPADFIIGLRLSEGKVNDLSYRFPLAQEEAKAILHEVNKAAPDYVHIAAEKGDWRVDCTYADGSSYTSLAKQITGVPVIANGGLHRLEVAEAVLRENHADLLALGTAALADPSWPNKIIAGLSPVPFIRELIKPSATIEHTWEMQEQYQGV